MFARIGAPSVVLRINPHAPRFMWYQPSLQRELTRPAAARSLDCQS